MRARLALLSCLVPALVRAQAAPATVRIHVATVAGPAPRVCVAAGTVVVLTDIEGDAMLRPPLGPLTVFVHGLGLAPDSARFVVRAGMDTTVAFLLHDQAAALAPVIVSSSRTERRIEDEPLRVEVLAGEDVGEKTQMRPADLRVLLSGGSVLFNTGRSPA